MTDEFAVEPSSASCWASQQSGVSATVSVSDAPREVSVTTTAPGLVTVELSCTNTGYVTGTATAVFTAVSIPAQPPVVISYFDGGSRSGAGLMTDLFTVKPSTAKCRPSRVSGIAADVWLSDDSWQLREISVETTGIGSVTVRLTCWHARHLSDTEYAVFTARTPTVKITGFDGVSGPSPLASEFTVEPSSARCYPIKGPGSDDVTLSWLDKLGRSRKLKVEKSTPGTVTVYMFCTEGPYNFDVATADFIVTEDEDQPEVVISGFSDSSGTGVLTSKFMVTPSTAICRGVVWRGPWVKVEFLDNMGQDREVFVKADTPGKMTVRLTCSKAGYSTGVEYSEFNLLPAAVEITNFVGGSRTGVRDMTGTFDVAPATADCTASASDGTEATVSPSGTSRTVELTTTTSGTITVTVTCGEEEDYADGTATADFTTREGACSRSLTLESDSTAIGGLLESSTVDPCRSSQLGNSKTLITPTVSTLPFRLLRWSPSTLNPPLQRTLRSHCM